MENQNPFIPPLNTTPLPATTPVQTPPLIIKQKPKRKLWKKILLFLLVFAGLIIIILYNIPRILTILYPSDDTLVDNSNLLIQKISIPDADNGFFDLDGIASTTLKIPVNAEGIPFNKEYSDFTKPVAWNQKLVDQVLKDNAQALLALDFASRKGYFQTPQLSDPATITMDTKYPAMNNWRTIAELQVIKALSLSLNGKPDEALQEALKLNKLGHNIITGHNSLIGSLVGLVIENMGSKTTLHILSVGNLKKDTLKNAVSSLSNNSNNLEGYKDAFRFEYTKLINEFDEAINSLFRNGTQQVADDSNFNSNLGPLAKYGYYYKQNQTTNLYTGLFSTEVSAIGNRCDITELLDQMQSHEEEFISGSKYGVVSKILFTENVIGKVLYSVGGLSLGTVVTKQCETDLFSNVAQIELALKEYKLDHKVLPPTLNELVPTYLSSIPVDPFDHKPIRYSVGKKILYSVGLKQIDVGGGVGDDWRTVDNPTFKIEF